MQNTPGWSPKACQTPEAEAGALAWSCAVGTLTVLLVWSQRGLVAVLMPW